MATKIGLSNIQTAAILALGGPVPKVTSITYASGTTLSTAGGQTITLTGTQFASGMNVLIGPTALPTGSQVTASSVVTVASSTRATFISPAKIAGNYVLFVINTDGGWASTPVTYA